jgi:hypothetical protein
MDPLVESELPLHPSMMICFGRRGLSSTISILCKLELTWVSDAALGQHQLSLPRAHMI